MDERLIFDLRPRRPAPRRELTSCLEPIHHADPIAAERFRRFYRSVGVDRFVVWDGGERLTSALGPLEDVEYHPWTFSTLLGADHIKTAKGGPIGQHLAMAYCAFVYRGDARMMLSLDLDEILVCSGERHLVKALQRANAMNDNPCACMLRWLYDAPLSPLAPLPKTVVARQMNRKCVVDPAALEDANFHKPKCKGHKGIYQVRRSTQTTVTPPPPLAQVDQNVCWINHYRNESLSGKQPQDAYPLPNGPEERPGDLSWAMSTLNAAPTWTLDPP